MKARTLFELHLIHPYYRDQRCLDFEIEPTRGTVQRLRNHRCILKSLPHGVRVLTTANPSATLPRTTFAFQLHLRNPDFALYTDLTEIDEKTKIDEKSSPVFTNTTQEDLVDLEIQSRPVTSVDAAPDQSLMAPDPVDRWLKRKVFADVDIHYNGAAWSDAAAPPTFRITFKAKAMRWIYDVVTDKSDVSQLNLEGFAKAVLTDRSQLPYHTLSEDAKDRRRKQQVVRFVSNEPFACQEAPRKPFQLQLSENDRVALPPPSLRQYGTHSETPRETALFYVFRYVTHPYLNKDLTLQVGTHGG